MRKILWLVPLFVIMFATLCYAPISDGPTMIKEEDGDPKIKNLLTLIVSNGTLTKNSGTSGTLDLSGTASGGGDGAFTDSGSIVNLTPSNSTDDVYLYTSQDLSVMDNLTAGAIFLSDGTEITGSYYTGPAMDTPTADNQTMRWDQANQTLEATSLLELDEDTNTADLDGTLDMTQSGEATIKMTDDVQTLHDLTIGSDGKLYVDGDMDDTDTGLAHDTPTADNQTMRWEHGEQTLKPTSILLVDDDTSRVTVSDRLIVGENVLASGDISASESLTGQAIFLADGTQITGSYYSGADVDLGTVDDQMLRWDQATQTFEVDSGIKFDEDTSRLTVDGNIHCAEIYGDGSNLTGISTSEDNNLEEVMTGVAINEIAIGQTGGDIGAYFAVTGDITMDDSGVTTLGNDKVDSQHYAAGSIDNEHMAVNSIDSDQYVDASIDNAHLADNAVDTAEIAADAVEGTKIADDQVDSEHYVAGSIDLEHMSSQSVDSDNIVDATIAIGDLANGTDGQLITWAADATAAVVTTGTADQVLTSNGAGAAPTFQDASGAGLWTDTDDGITVSQDATITGSLSTSSDLTTSNVLFTGGDNAVLFDDDDNAQFQVGTTATLAMDLTIDSASTSLSTAAMRIGTDLTTDGTHIFWKGEQLSA